VPTEQRVVAAIEGAGYPKPPSSIFFVAGDVSSSHRNPHSLSHPLSHSPSHPLPHSLPHPLQCNRLLLTATSSMVSSKSPDCAASSRKRPREEPSTPPPQPAKHRRLRKLAPIETLPGDVLQSILYYSANIHLTQASPTILKALNGLYSTQSKLIYKSFSMCVFRDFCSRISSRQEFHLDKMRVMNSRFFTWPLFLDLVRDINSLYLNTRHLTRAYLQRRKSEEYKKHISSLNWEFREPWHGDMMAQVSKDCKRVVRFPEDLASGYAYSATYMESNFLVAFVPEFFFLTITDSGPPSLPPIWVITWRDLFGNTWILQQRRIFMRFSL